MVYHELGLRFDSPTINVYIRPNDFVKMCENLEYYMEIEPIEIFKYTELKYPVAQLGDDIIIFCKHYKTFGEFREKWNERKNRINYDNIFIIMTDRFCCSQSSLRRFDKLPFKNKICFVAPRNYDNENKSLRVIDHKSDVCVGVITEVQDLMGRRLFEYAKDFNYIEWLNGDNNE